MHLVTLKSMIGELRFIMVAWELDHVSKSRHPNDIVPPDIRGLWSGIYVAEFAIVELPPISYQNDGGRNGESH